jgi:hypothetical protein
MLASWQRIVYLWNKIGWYLPGTEAVLDLMFGEPTLCSARVSVEVNVIIFQNGKNLIFVVVSSLKT